MKLFSLAALLFAVFQVDPTFARERVQRMDVAAGVRSYHNYAASGDCQDKRGWTASAGSFSLTDTAADIFQGQGNKSCEWTPGGSGNFMTNDTFTITSGAGPGLMDAALTCYYKTASANYDVEILHAGSIVQKLDLPPSSGFRPFEMVQHFPSSGTVGFRLKSGDITKINWVGCFHGDARGVNLGNVSQGGVIGSIEFDNTCDWTVSQGSPTNYSNDASCGTTPSGAIQAISGVRPGFVIPVAEAGYYVATWSGAFLKNNTGAPSCSYRFYDGSNVWGLAQIGTNGAVTASSSLVGSYLLSDAATNLTVDVQAWISGATACDILGSTISPGPPNKVTVQWFPLKTGQIVKPNEAIKYAISNFTVGSSAFTTSSASYVDVTAANLWGARTNYGSATACTDSQAICVKYPNMPAGEWTIEISTLIGMSTSGNACWFEIHDGADVLESEKSRDWSSTPGHAPATTKFTKNYASLSDREFVLKLKRVSGAGVCTAASNVGATHLGIWPANSPRPAPLLVNSVISGNAGVMRIEGAYVTGGNPPTVTSTKSSDWLTFSSRTGVGDYTFSHNYSSTPMCVFGALQSSDVNVFLHQAYMFSISASSIRVLQNHTQDGGAVNADDSPKFNILCFGQN
jgi:hypothetical protein